MRRKMIMRTLLMTLLVVTFSLNGVAGAKKAEVIQSSWMTTPIEIDGLSKEWNQDTWSYEKKVESNYAFANSENFLYVLYVFKNPRFLSSIRHTGFTVWFNTEGKKDKAYGVKFIEKEITADELIARMEKEQGPLQDFQKGQIKQQSPTYFIYTGEVIDGEGNVLTEASLEGKKEMPAFRSMPVKGIGIIHEFRIPFSIFEKISADYALEPGQDIKICFDWGGFTKDVQDAMAKDQAERNIASRTREGAAEMGTHERRDGSSRDRFSSMAALRNRAKRYQIWVDVKLANKE